MVQRRRLMSSTVIVTSGRTVGESENGMWEAMLSGVERVATRLKLAHDGTHGCALRA